jgi:hypothetical protein
MNSGSLRRERWIDLHDVRHAQQAGDRVGVADEIVAELVIEAGVDRVGGRDQKQRVAVRRRFHHALGRDVAARAGTVLDHELLAEPFG